MEIKRKNNKKFEPYTIEIKIESKQDEKFLYLLGWFDSTVPYELRSVVKNYPEYKSALGDLVNTCIRFQNQILETIPKPFES